MPTSTQDTYVEEINPHLSNAKWFAKSGYWCVKLSEQSQPLTTFRTPFGRYCFQRLPFGLNISQDVFQQYILNKCDGCVGISGDVIVYGTKATSTSSSR